jgi:hypothetical protein
MFECGKDPFNGFRSGESSGRRKGPPRAVYDHNVVRAKYFLYVEIFPDWRRLLPTLLKCRASGFVQSQFDSTDFIRFRLRKHHQSRWLNSLFRLSDSFRETGLPSPAFDVARTFAAQN